MALSHKEKLVLGFFYHCASGGSSISDAYRELHLDSSDENFVKLDLTSQYLIRPVVTNQEGSFYKITQHGRQVYESLL